MRAYNAYERAPISRHTNPGVLKIATCQTAARPAPSPPRPTLLGRTVLVIEDHKASRDPLTSVRRGLRAHVVAVPNIEQAELELQFSRPHLIICDMKLPDGTGLDFILDGRITSSARPRAGWRSSSAESALGAPSRSRDDPVGVDFSTPSSA